MSPPQSQSVDSRLYDKDYFEATDGAGYFFAGRAAPKFLKAIQICGIKPGDNVLDIGCGRGDLTLALAARGARVTGVDYSASAIEIAKQAVARLLPESRKNVKILRSDAACLGFADQTFDHVFMMDIAEHLYPGQLQACFRECRRTLKDGGKLIVHTSPNRWYNDAGYPLWERPVNKILNAWFKQNLLVRPIRCEMDLKVHVNEQTVVSLKKYFAEAGFNPKIWLGNEYVLPVKKDSAIMQVLEICRQIVCHAFPLSLIPPLNYIFSNNIWAVGQKTL